MQFVNFACLGRIISVVIWSGYFSSSVDGQPKYIQFCVWPKLAGPCCHIDSARAIIGLSRLEAKTKNASFGGHSLFRSRALGILIFENPAGSSALKSPLRHGPHSRHTPPHHGRQRRRSRRPKPGTLNRRIPFSSNPTPSHRRDSVQVRRRSPELWPPPCHSLTRVLCSCRGTGAVRAPFHSLPVSSPPSLANLSVFGADLDLWLC